MTDRVRLIVDCDPGNGIPGANVDDGLALGYAIGAEERFDLRAVTVVAGNTAVPDGVAVATELLRLGGSTAPVGRGADRPLVVDPSEWRERLDHRAVGAGLDHLWAGIPSPPHITDFADAVDLLVRTALAEPTVLVAIGPLTNVALALQRAPSLAAALTRIVVMGGCLDVPGVRVDTNFGYDPDAAAAVLRSGATMTLVPLDVTRATAFSDLDALGAIGTPLTDRLTITSRPWARYVKATRRLESFPIHDVLAVALLDDPSLVRHRRAHVAVDLDHGADRGRLLEVDGGSEVDLVTAVDAGRLNVALLRRLRRARGFRSD